MNNALMKSTWKSQLPHGRKFVLLALCDSADDRGECCPTVSTLAHKCSMGERTVQQHMKDLETDGIVSRAMRSGRSTVYSINHRKICTSSESAQR